MTGNTDNAEFQGAGYETPRRARCVVMSSCRVLTDTGEHGEIRLKRRMYEEGGLLRHAMIHGRRNSNSSSSSSSGSDSRCSDSR